MSVCNNSCFLAYPTGETSEIGPQYMHHCSGLNPKQCSSTETIRQGYMSKCQNLQRNQISLIIAQNEACAHVRGSNTSSQENMKSLRSIP